LAARCALAGVVFYAVVDTALVFLRPRFSVLHNAESDYGSRGPWAWLMDFNFLLRCLLSLAAVAAVLLALRGREKGGRVRGGIALLVVWATASGLLAFFPDDPVGTTAQGSGKIHLALAFVAFIAVLTGAVLVSLALRRRAPWKRVTVPMAALSLGALVPLVLLARVHLAKSSLGGLYEKIFLAMELLWLVVLAAPLAVGTASTVSTAGAG
jgi:hypothetical membrane protein